jgi:hypothetical protein
LGSAIYVAAQSIVVEAGAQDRIDGEEWTMRLGVERERERERESRDKNVRRGSDAAGRNMQREFLRDSAVGRPRL